jgi:hypothetical protein
VSEARATAGLKNSSAQCLQKKYAPLIFVNLAFRERYYLKSAASRLYFAIGDGDQRFRPLDHRAVASGILLFFSFFWFEKNLYLYYFT